MFLSPGIWLTIEALQLTGRPEAASNPRKFRFFARSLFRVQFVRHSFPRTEVVMKMIQAAAICLLLTLLSTPAAMAMPLNSSARAVVPGELLQLISVDYRELKDATRAMALKQQLLPDNLKQFEGSLKGIGVDPDKDVDTLTFASFRSGKQGVRGVGIASGSFNLKSVLKKMRLQKFKPTKYRNCDLYPMDGGMLMSFLDDSTLLFGEPSAVRSALDVRDGQALNVDSNASMAGMMSAVDSAPVWSIVDHRGTQNLISPALGVASKSPEYGPRN